MTIKQIIDFILLQEKLEQEAKKKSMFFFVDPRKTMDKILYG